MKIKTPLSVLLVEDDHLQAGWITDTLEHAFPKIKVKPIRTEAEFYYGFDEIVSKPPDVVIMDVMLRWTDPAPDMVTPPDVVRNEGYRRAGLRCVQMLAGQSATKNIPVILFTVLDRSDLEFETPCNVDNLLYVSKESEPEELINKIRNVLSRE